MSAGFIATPALMGLSKDTKPVSDIDLDIFDAILVAGGQAVTGFANVAQDFADNVVWDMNALPRGQHVVPWRIEDELRALGTNYV